MIRVTDEVPTRVQVTVLLFLQVTPQRLRARTPLAHSRPTQERLGRPGQKRLACPEFLVIGLASGAGEIHRPRNSYVTLLVERYIYGDISRRQSRFKDASTKDDQPPPTWLFGAIKARICNDHHVG